jgi:Protein of unknown function (DUF2795)
MFVNFVFKSFQEKGKYVMAAINPIQLEKFLKGVDYPARNADLIKKAEQNGADENVRSTLEQLPDQQFQTPADVSQAVGALNRKK